ncbi:hypothetical protein AB0L70_29465 [Kribbella sp. NPDC051952]|uniref:hypothetical protein n=1 Tax=Kribbella sp. NPDC051952 TaxID=3154851 RepID=UPI00343AC47B
MLIVSIALVLVALAYFVTTTLVDLRPLNNVTAASPRERRTEVLVNVPLLLVPAVLLVLGGLLDQVWPVYAGAGAEAVAALGGLALWWLPYLVGVTVPWATAGAGTSWAELHARTYAHTIIVLPRIGDRPRPNLEHMILHSLFLAAAVTGFIAAAG